MMFRYHSWSDAAIYERKIYLTKLEPGTEYEIKVYIQYYEVNIPIMKSVKTLPEFDFKQKLILINLVLCCLFILTLIGNLYILKKYKEKSFNLFK